MPGEAELRATSDVLLAALDEMRAVEELKRQVPPDDPRFADLAAQVDSLARTILEHSHEQRERAESDRLPTIPIEAIPADAPMASILERWRAAERRLEAAPPGSEEALAAEADAAVCREAYRRAWEARADHG